MIGKIRVGNLELEGEEMFVSRIVKNLLTTNYNEIPEILSYSSSLKGGTQDVVIDFLNNNVGKTLTSKQIYSGIDMKQGTISPVLTRLVKNKFIFRVNRNKYSVPYLIKFKSKKKGRGVSKKHWSVSDDSNLLELSSNGLSVGEICGRLGRTYDSVYSRLKKLRKNNYIVKGGI